MDEKIKEEKIFFDALSSMFEAINKLCTFYKFDQAIEIMNLYLKNNNVSILPAQDGIRDYIVFKNIRNILYPVIIDNADDLYGYFNLMINGKLKNNLK